MKSVIFAFLVSSLCLGSAIAQELGNSREHPVKNTPIVTYEPPVVPRQGGDTIFDAYPIVGLPFTDTGTTAGYFNDYDEACPYTGSTSPDVVYSFTPDSDGLFNVDLCGSAYDTKLYIYDSDLNRIACNDDAYFDDVCGDYVSAIEEAALIGGTNYFIVIDGYGGDAGDYVLLVEDNVDVPCFVYCPDDAVDEGEPPLHDGYVDAYNGGCNSDGYPFQAIDWTNDEDGLPPYDGTAWMCGKSGWYINSEGNSSRDTDWFTVIPLETGEMEITVESKYPCYIVTMATLDCAANDPELIGIADCEAPETLTFSVTAGQEFWLVVVPTTFSGPVTEFTYFMTVSNNTFDVVSDEKMSLGQVKALYR